VTAHDTAGDPAPSAGPRQVAAALLRIVVAVGGLLLVYFQMPLGAGDHIALALVTVAVGLLAFGAIFVRQVRRIRSAEYPMLRAVEGTALVGCLFVVVVASIHYSLWFADHDSYSEALSRLDALYFTVTTLATVGFGDITPTSPSTRAVTTVQMVLGVALLGAGVRILIGVASQVNEDRRRRVSPPT
jgi:voltage-gated potassium channel